MHHGPAVKLGEDHSADIKASIGVKLFFVYCLVYFGFVAINTMKPRLMDKVIFAGLNLAVVYGFGLIVLAIVMGLVYNHICTKWEDKLNNEELKKNEVEDK